MIKINEITKFFPKFRGAKVRKHRSLPSFKIILLFFFESRFNSTQSNKFRFQCPSERHATPHKRSSAHGSVVKNGGHPIVERDEQWRTACQDPRQRDQEGDGKVGGERRGGGQRSAPDRIRQADQLQVQLL